MGQRGRLAQNDIKYLSYSTETEHWTLAKLKIWPSFCSGHQFQQIPISCSTGSHQRPGAATGGGKLLQLARQLFSRWRHHRSQPQMSRVSRLIKHSLIHVEKLQYFLHSLLLHRKWHINLAALKEAWQTHKTSWEGTQFWEWPHALLAEGPRINSNILCWLENQLGPSAVLLEQRQYKQVSWFLVVAV